MKDSPYGITVPFRTNATINKFRVLSPKNTVLVGITRRVGIDDLQKGPVDSWEKRQTAMAATPFFRAR